MKFEKDVQEQIKKEFGIPDKYISISTDIEMVENYFKDGIKWETIHQDTTHIKTDIKDKSTKDLKYKKGIYKLDNVYYVNIMLYAEHDAFYENYATVYAESIEAYDEFIKKNTKFDETKIPRLPFGSYKLKQTDQGIMPVPITLSEELPPILNDDINTALNKEIEIFKKKKDWYDKNNLTHKRGFLLYGPPGNGKTSYIKNLDTSDKILVFLDVQDNYQLDFITNFLSNEDYKDITKIIVMEDLERMNSGRTHVLNMLDGIFEVENTVFLATTNYPEQLDAAITKRPSRFDSLYPIDLPCKHTREKIFKLYFPKASNEDCKKGAELTEGYSGAYIKELKILAEYYETNIPDTITMMKKKFDDFKVMLDKNYMG